MKIRITNSRGAPALGITVLLASLSMISPLSIDTFLPSFPTIADEYGISAERVRQIEAGAMKKLRKAIEARP